MPASWDTSSCAARTDASACCGRKGCLETYCSATGVARTAREFLAARTEESLLRAIPAETITSKDVYDAAVKGDKLAQDIFDYTGNILGEALADFIAFSSPEAIILFGGLAKSGEYIFKPIQPLHRRKRIAHLQRQDQSC